MSGRGPARAAELGLPTPRLESAESDSQPAPVRTAARDEAAAEIPTEAHQALLHADDTGAEPGTGDLFDLLRSPHPDEAGTRTAGTGDDAPGSPRRSPTPSDAPSRDDTPTSSDAPIARSNGVWFWMWGPLLAAVLVVSFLAGMASAPFTIPAPTTPHPATILDVRGRTLTTVEPPAGSDPVSTEQLPEMLLRAVVAVQDPGYFSRNGLSATELVKAGAADLVRVRRHGTTIEERYVQQARVATGSRLPSLREAGVSARLAQRLSRQALLARYVNGMYFGNGVYGVSAAARFYFGTSVTSLDAAQIAMLAGISDDPSHTNPVSAPALAIAAQQHAIRAMRTAGLLDPAQADAALREPIDARAHRQLERPSPAPDFTALVESSLLSRYGDDGVYGQDLRVATPLDLDLQTALSDTIRRLVPTNVPAVLALATDPRTGDIRAMVNRSASSSASGPEGASDVLFTRRPLGSLAGALPVPVGDGHSASLGELAADVGAIATDGTRHDLRPLISVTRPSVAGRPAQTLDAVDPLPAGQPLLAPERAEAASAALRTSDRLPGSPAAGLPFVLTAVSGSVPSSPAGSVATTPPGRDEGPAWYVGCVPELCLTVWTGDASGGGGPPEAVPDAALAGSIVVGTFQQYNAVAPGRLTLPALPRPRTAGPRSPATAPTPAAVPPPLPSVLMTLQPSATASAAPTRKPQPSLPSASPAPTASPSPDAGGGSSGGSGSGTGNPVAEPPPKQTVGGRPGA